MPRSGDDTNHAAFTTQFAESERDIDSFKQGLRKLVAYHRERLARAEAALAALEGKSARPAEKRINKAVKDYLARFGPQTRAEIKAELLRAGIITDNKVDNSRVDRSLRQCVNSHTLLEREGKFEVPASQENEE